MHAPAADAPPVAAFFRSNARCNPSPSDVAEFAKKKNELKEKTSKLLQIGKEKQAGFTTHSNKRKERAFANQFKALV